MIRSRLDYEDEELKGLAGFACSARKSKGRLQQEPEHEYRTVFQRDRDRVVHCRAFRRLEYKTQVFIFHEGDHYRNRLTHTLEASQIARTCARALRGNEDLAEAIVLAHDLGHTPFGHAGEHALAELMEGHGGFDHNRQTLRIVDWLEERYPGITGFMETCVSEAEKNGFVTTMLGRRRPISEIHSNNRNLRALGERLAINTVVQGSAADMIKQAMVNLHERIDRAELDMRLLIQVHDELVLDAPLEKVEEYSEIVRQEMAGAIELAVPVKVDVAWGKNWLESK